MLLALGLTSMGKSSRRQAAAPLLPDRIWATTFTRAAARGDRGACGEGVTRAGAGARRFACAVRAEIAARAAMLDEIPSATVLRRRAAEALARWPAARIDTLHGLAARIVDRHGLALGLPPGMRVLDEDEAAHLGALAVDEVLGRALGAGVKRPRSARALFSPRQAGLVRCARSSRGCSIGSTKRVWSPPR